MFEFNLKEYMHCANELKMHFSHCYNTLMRTTCFCEDVFQDCMYFGLTEA